MKDDPEIQAMIKCGEILTHLQDATRARVVSWLNERFSCPPDTTQPPKNAHTSPPEPAHQAPANDEPLTEQFVAVFNRAAPETDSDKVVIAAWFVSEKQGEKEFTSYSIGQMLTAQGHHLSNVSQTVAQLVKKKPALLHQVRKSGKTKQARKLLSITEAGKDAATKMLHQ